MSRYLYRAEMIAQESIDLVSELEADALSRALAEAGPQAWETWALENREEATAFLRAAPATRLRKKSWQNPALRARLALEAHRLGCLAVAVLYRGGSGYSGLGYREAVECAVSAAFYILAESQKRYWPWPCKPPFPEWIALRWSPDCEDDYDPGFSPPGWEAFQAARERADGELSKD